MGEKIQLIDHIGIAVSNLDEAVQTYTQILGATPDHFETLESEGVSTAFFAVGDTHLELLEATHDESPIAKYIQKNGRGGLHHICLKVQDIQKKLDELKAAGVQLIDQKPRAGAHGKLVAFVHPKAMGGVLLELSQDAES